MLSIGNLENIEKYKREKNENDFLFKDNRFNIWVYCFFSVFVCVYLYIVIKMLLGCIYYFVGCV